MPPENPAYPPEYYDLPVDQAGIHDEPRFRRDLDMMEQYGSIIKDLTDTEQMLILFELRQVGKILNGDGEIVEVEHAEARMSERAAKEFMDIVRSIVNQNTHFSRFDKDVVCDILSGANYNINRWLMIQGEDVPLRHRSKIAFEAMNLINASLHKAREGTILQWTKGSFKEGIQRGGAAQQNSQGSFNLLNPFSWNKK